MQKICSNNHLGDEMGDDDDKEPIVEKKYYTNVFTETREQKAGILKSITGRPNIDEISKRNEEEEKQERKSSYLVKGIILLFVLVAVLLLYFFS